MRTTTAVRVAAGFALLVMALVIASQKGPALPPNLPEDFRIDQFRKSPDPNSSFDQSDLVLIGTVQAVKSIGPPRRASENRDVWIEPFEIGIRVENEIKGATSPSVIEAYGYLFSRRNNRQLGHPLPFLPQPGERRLLFLRVEGNRFRLLHDVFDYSVRVLSGGHTRIDPAYASSPKMAAAWILLARGQNCLSETFAARLMEYVWFAYEFAGAPTMMQLLGALAEDPSPEVRSEAAELLRAFDTDIKQGHEPFGGPHPNAWD